MARVSGGLFSLDSSGQLGKSIVYSIWNGLQYVRRYTTPANPKTEEQGAQRLRLAAVGRFSKLVNSLSEFAAALRMIAPAGQSYVSYFNKQSFVNLSESLEDYAEYGNAEVAGLFDAAAITAGITSASIPYATPSSISGGAILWNAYQTAFTLGLAEPAGPASTATAPDISDFVDFVTDTPTP